MNGVTQAEPAAWVGVVVAVVGIPAVWAMWFWWIPLDRFFRDFWSMGRTVSTDEAKERREDRSQLWGGRVRKLILVNAVLFTIAFSFLLVDSLLRWFGL